MPEGKQGNSVHNNSWIIALRLVNDLLTTVLLIRKGRQIMSFPSSQWVCLGSRLRKHSQCLGVKSSTVNNFNSDIWWYFYVCMYNFVT